MPGLMGDHAIDIVGTPAIVLVMHHKTRPAKARVRKMMQAILYKKNEVRPIRAKSSPQIPRILTHGREPWAISQACESGIAPGGLEILIGGSALRLSSVRRDRLDVVHPGYVPGRSLPSQPGEPVLNLGNDLDPFLARKFQLTLGAIHDEKSDCDPPGQSVAGARRRRSGLNV